MRNIQSIKTLGSNKWCSLVEASYNDGTAYTYLHESSSKGIKIAILPYKYKSDGVQFLVRDEVTPPWDANEQKPSSVTGSSEEHETFVETAVKELKEECGYITTVDQIESLGLCYGVKSADTVYMLYAVDVTNSPQIEIEAPDTFENEASNRWVDMGDFYNLERVVDPIFFTLYTKLLFKFAANKK